MPRAGVLGAALVLQHVPDLVRYGSKPLREETRLPELLGALRTYERRASPIRPTRSSSATRGRKSCGSSRDRGGTGPRPSPARSPASAPTASSCRSPSTTSCWRRSISSTSSGSGPSPTRRRARSRYTRETGSRCLRACPRPRRVAPGDGAAREPRVQGERSSRASLPARADGHRSRVDRVCPRLWRGGGGRPLSARRRGAREGDRRRFGAHPRERE